MQTLMPTIRPTMLVPGIGGFTLGSRLWDVAGLRPSLDLQLATTKSLVDAITGQDLVTFTRASSGTYVDSQGVIQTATNNVPRFDHSPTTGESLGLLREEQRSNLLLHNRTLTNAAWTATNITAAKDQVGADGVSNSASSITASNANGTIVQAVTSASAARATSAYVKRITGTGTVEMTQNGGSTWTAVTVTSAWTRVTIPSATVTNPSVGFRIVTNGDAIAVDYVQLESGAFSTSAIETTATAVTRLADVASITGANLGSWYNQTEGTAFVDALPSSTASNGLVGFDDTTNNERWRLSHSGGTTGGFLIVDGNVTQANIASAASSWPLNASGKIAGGVKLNNSAVCVNGQTPIEDLSCTMPTVTQATIGTAQGVVNSACRIRRITYWPTRLPNSTLQLLTQ